MPRNESYVLERAKVFQSLQMFEQAIDDYTTILNINPHNPKVLFRRGFAYKAIKKYQDAIVDFAKAKSMDPANARFNINHK